MYKVAITGGIGSGKSKVVELLAQRGVAAYDSDSRAKALMASSPELREQIIECFGPAAYDGEEVNRRYLAERVFNDKEALTKLNAIVHPAVMADFERWAEGEEGNYVVMESAILFEAGLEGSFDATVSVMAPEELRLERAMKRDGATEEQIRERMRNQLSDEERCDRSTFAIVNIELDDLEDDVEQLHRRLSYDSQSR
ncbi:MAG: dephospho-CoA kinase [Rikenellaceae bacterium]|nr:dephospho-CoA kinase [Rikenellaceae bacterium]